MHTLLRAGALFLASFVLAGAAAAACVTQTIAFGETKSGTLTTDDCLYQQTNNGHLDDYYYDYFQFSGTAGQQVAVAGNSGTFDPFLFLINPDKTFVSDDNSGGGVNARIPAGGFVTLAQTGTYAIEMISAAPAQTGSYTLTLTLFVPPPPAGCTIAAAPASTSGAPLPPGTSVQLTASCASGQGPITYTWDGGAVTGSVRTVAPTVTTSYTMVASNAGGAAPAAGITVYVTTPPVPATPTVEFYNIDLGHYFVTAVQAEAAAIDNGSAGPGWVRTGFSYDVFGNQAALTNPVCRFYGTPGVGPNSHFYTVDAAECTAVKKDPGWFYEGIAYYIQPPQFGNCPAGTQPIYRAYNQRAQFNDSNHRFITNLATFQQMGDRGWSMEGIVMCTTSVRAPTPVTGGTFTAPGGASVVVAPGQIPSYTNATQPSTRPSTQLPPGMTIHGNQGETNVTTGGPGYDFNLSGDSGFSTTTAGAVTVTLPFDASAIPAADQGDPAKTFVRVLNPQDNSQVDLAGDMTTNGPAGLLTVETRGLPRQFTAAVIYNPNMDAASSDDATPTAAGAPVPAKAGSTTWPAQSWCVLYNAASPDLIAAVKSVLGLPGNPSRAQIKSVVANKVGGGARRAQTVYENDGHNGPDLVINRACRGSVSRYNIHMTTEGSYYMPKDPGEAVNRRHNHYGRLYISDARVDDAANTDLGSVLASIAHEMHHGIQIGYELLGTSPDGYIEGAATVYGKTIDGGAGIKVRTEVQGLDASLMSPAEGLSYANEDFFAYVAKQYNGGSLGYTSGLYAQMHASIGSNVNNPAASVMYGAMDTYFKAKFPSQTLQTIYLDFLKQRALTHNAASQLGHAGEVVNGYADALFGNGQYRQDMPVATTNCDAQKVSLSYPGLAPFSARAIVINATGNVPANSSGPTLVVKIAPASSSLGALWNGYTWRAGAAATLAATNKFAGFGKQAGEQIVIIVANMDPAHTGAFNFEISCGGLQIDSIAPVKGPVDTVVTINGSGFGSASDTRSVSFNGVNATTVNFANDTQATARVPANASSGDVVVTVNGQKSNGVNFEVVALCSATQNAGGDTPDTRTIELGKPAGTFVFTYDTYFQEDEIIVRYQGNTLFDTGCVGASGSQSLNYSGTATSITVQVIPNCKTGTGTAWQYSVSCP